MRYGEIKRTTAETDIAVSIALDGSGRAKAESGIGFFDHMLTLFAAHGLFDLNVLCHGDVHVDGHHSVEDIGIALGQALRQAIGDKRGITRYGTFFLPMDETLAFVSLDISGRPFLVYECDGMAPMIGGYDTELTEEFLRALAVHAGLTLHVRVLYGTNSHHKVEAIFKALGHALRCRRIRVWTAFPPRRGCCSMVAVIDYGVGNLFSVEKAFAAVGAEVGVTRAAEALKRADKLVLPGVGAFGDCMRNLEATGLIPVIREEIAAGKPLLGICVGLQILFEGSEETPEAKGLGIFKGIVRKIHAPGLKVPHMGWNSIRCRQDSRLLSGLGGQPYVYFVHSYHAVPEDRGIVLATTEYGEELTAAVAWKNVQATQFHPEKSGDIGLRILKNFMEGE